MKTNYSKITFAIFILGLLFLMGCLAQSNNPNETKNETGDNTSAFETISLSGINTKQVPIAEYYSLDSINIKSNISEYNLPLETSEISNYADFSSKIQLNNEALDLLNKNGFAIIKNPFNGKEEDITVPYKSLKTAEIPIFITSDSLLHLYHIQFDETLRQIEEKEFYDAIWTVDKELLAKSIQDYDAATGDLKEAAKMNVAYLSVALSLLQPKTEQIMKECGTEDWQCKNQDTTAFFSKDEQGKYSFDIPSYVVKDVEKELDAIEKHTGFSKSTIFNYQEDYSQYIPRGHYTRSEKLKNYFKAFMWHGRISMLLKGELIESKDKARDAKIQTMAASLIASHLASNKEIIDKWDRIYEVTSFYVGVSDDLGPYEYIESMQSVFGNNFDPLSLNDETVLKLKAKLAEYPNPKIYGGTGDCVINPPFNAEQADQCMGNTKGFRLMGQRFIPDSYMFQNLVFPKVGQYLGDKKPFTLRNDPNVGLIRDPPRGLDVMALLGSERAVELLAKTDDSNYESYSSQFNLLKQEFDNFSVEEWNKNLYWAWLYSLKPLLQDFDKGYPTFMQNKAWQDKELTTALASWTELRHDTILYAKQSYGLQTMSGPPPQPKPVVGYVEPVPEFYNQLLALTRMTIKGLEEKNVLDETSKARLSDLENILARLVEISKQELENKELSEDDYQFIRYFGDNLKGVIADVEEKAQMTTIVADVHTAGTDMNFKQGRAVLEEGVGYVDIIVVAYKVPDGRIIIGAGPVMTYYEFKQPMADRLTDEKWREMLLKNPPEKPDFFCIY